MVPYKKTDNLINNMFSNSYIKVYIDGQIWQKYRLNNSLPQGSVLAPPLCIYTLDLASTSAKKVSIC